MTKNNIEAKKGKIILKNKINNTNSFNNKGNNNDKIIQINIIIIVQEKSNQK